MTDTTNPVEDRPAGAPAPAAKASRLTSRWFAAGLLGIALLALVVRLGYTLEVSDDMPLVGDAQTYHLLAGRLADGDGYVRPQGELEGTPTAEFPPLFPFVLAGVDLAGGDSIKAQKVATSLLGVGTVVLVGLAGRRVRSRAAGLTAAGLAAIYPMLFQVDGALMAESLYAFLVSAFLLAMYRALDEPTAVNWIVTGVVVGLAALTRTEGILLLPLVVLPEALRRGGMTSRARWGAAGVSVLATLVVVMPWITRNAVEFDRFIPISNNSGTLMAGANCDRSYNGQYRGIWRFECVTDIDVAGLDEPEIADRFRTVGTEYATDHASEVPGVVAVRVLRTFGLYEPKQQMDWESFEGRNITWQVAGHRMFLVLLPLSVIGGVVLWRSRRPLWPLVAPALIVAFTSAISYGNQRFRILAEPALLILAAIALAAAASWVWSRLASRSVST